MAVVTSAFATQPVRAQTTNRASDTDAAAQRALEAGREPSGYRELIDEALRESDAKNYEEARALFLRAHALFPNARTHRGIAMTEFELRNYPACITEIEAALSSTVRPLEQKLRPDAEQLLARAKSFVGRLLVETKPAASELRLDGLPVTSATGEALVLKLGEHLVEAHTPGYLPEKRQISVKGGETQTVTILFSRPEHAQSSAAQVDGRRWYKSPWLWTAVGVVVAGSATAAALATRQQHSKVAAPFPGNVGTLEGP